MAAALQCEICGGKLMGKPGGIFECDSCGMEYSTEWAKAKIQEIKGTVKVEGTVEVTGTVQVAGNATVESLCSRGFFELESRNSKAAKEAFSRALDINTNCGDVYMGLLMADYSGYPRIWTKEDFYKRLMDRQLDKNKYFRKIMTYPGSQELNAKVAEYKAMVEAQAKAREENTRRGAQNVRTYRALREKYAPIRQLLTNSGWEIVNDQGNVLRTESLELYEEWPHMLSFDSYVSIYAVIEAGIREDGAVIAEIGPVKVQIFEPTEQVIQLRFRKDQEHDTYQFAGLRRDGTVLFRYYKKDVGLVAPGEDRPVLWKNVAYLCGGERIGAVCKDGTYLEDSKFGPLPYENIAWVERLDDYYSQAFVLLEDGTVRLHKFGDDRIVSKVETWSDIIQIAWNKSTYGEHRITLYGLKADGTVLCDEDDYSLKNWKNIAFLSKNGMMGVTCDGRILGYGAPEDSSFRLFRNLDTLEQEREQRRSRAFENWKAEKARRQEEQSQLEARQESILQEIAGLSFLAFRRRKELEGELASVLLKLDELAEGI